MSGNKIYKPKAISGFPEWLPETRLVEQQWLDHIRKVFESYGFCSIETPSVEELDVITAKGEVDKEIYVLERLHKEDGGKEARLALHFDQTVPLARYVAQHFNDLVFPFKRYQMQRVWRGERPQAGRFREFTQCDIDVIAQDTLPLHFDAEMPAIIWETLSSLPGMENEKIQIRISNRKILMGVIQNELEIPDDDGVANIFRIVDKLEKVELEEFLKNLNNEILAHNPNCLPKQIERFVELLARLKNLSDESIDTQLKVLYALIEQAERNPLTIEGLRDLCIVLESLKHLPVGAVVADLSIVRGLDYYTGTVYETTFVDDPGYGTICAGGRYDDLASSYINKALPGVGISIGFSRLFARLHEQGKLPVGPKSPADILMVLPSDERREVATQTAQTLRKRGFKVELFHSGSKLKRQMAYAEKKKIPYVWFPPFEDNSEHEVKCMESGEQSKADPENWTTDE